MGKIISATGFLAGGVIIGVTIGVGITVSAIQAGTWFVEPDIHLQSEEIRSHIRSVINIPKEAYDLKFFQVASWTDWSKWISFQSTPEKTNATVAEFFAIHKVRESRHVQSHSEHTFWNSGRPTAEADWWPSDVTSADVYQGDHFQLAHFKDVGRIYLYFYTR